MKTNLTIVLLAIAPLFHMCAQPTGNRRAYGPCEGCEAVFEYGSKKLHSTDTLPDFHDKGDKIRIHGTIYKNDGKTPAAGVILYIYHTDQAGVYPTRGGETGWEKRHGYLRGWIKTAPTGTMHSTHCVPLPILTHATRSTYMPRSKNPIKKSTG
ncbi:MAG: hypothetical protein HC859_10755 [Bacteroidia bacterium]|nr:hypothetical protein [Bacteroidia bacterium]